MRIQIRSHKILLRNVRGGEIFEKEEKLLLGEKICPQTLVWGLFALFPAPSKSGPFTELSLDKTRERNTRLRRGDGEKMPSWDHRALSS